MTALAPKTRDLALAILISLAGMHKGAAPREHVDKWVRFKSSDQPLVS